MVSKNKLKILVINRWVGYNEGGNETHIKDLMAWFIKVGHEVHVITTKGDKLEHMRGKLHLHYVNSKQGYYSYGALGIVFALIFDIKCLFKFLELYISGIRFDVMSIHFALEAVLARFIKLFFGIPYVMILAGDTPIELIEAKRADGKIQISEFMNDQCKKYGYSSEIIPKGFDLKRFNPEIETKDLIESLGVKGKKIILTVCRLDPRKNLISLIESADIIVNKKKNKDFVFLIAGDGVERDLLLEEIKKHKLEGVVRLVGSVSNTSNLLPKYYAMSDLYVLPTLYEGFGWVFLEAMASGLPIITTNVASNPEIVGDVGKLVPLKNPKVLAETILETLNDRKELSKMTKLGLEKAQRFTWEEQIKKYDAYYFKVSKNKCNSLSCKLSVFSSAVRDISDLFISLIKDKVIFNFRSKESNWRPAGQEGGK